MIGQLKVYTKKANPSNIINRHSKAGGVVTCFPARPVLFKNDFMKEREIQDYLFVRCNCEKSGTFN